MMKYVKNPWVLIVVCMILTAVLYNAGEGPLRWLSYVPLAVLVYLVGKAIYMAWFINKD